MYKEASELQTVQQNRQKEAAGMVKTIDEMHIKNGYNIEKTKAQLKLLVATQPNLGIDPAMVDRIQDVLPDGKVKIQIDSGHSFVMFPDGKFEQIKDDKEFKTPDILTEYEYAKKQGFKGSLFDFKKQLAHAGRADSSEKPPQSRVYIDKANGARHVVDLKNPTHKKWLAKYGKQLIPETEGKDQEFGEEEQAPSKYQVKVVK
jgi:hypothetical protein